MQKQLIYGVQNYSVCKAKFRNKIKQRIKSEYQKNIVEGI